MSGAKNLDGDKAKCANPKKKIIIKCTQFCVCKSMCLTGDADDFERTPTRAMKSTGQHGTVNDKE